MRDAMLKPSGAAVRERTPSIWQTWQRLLRLAGARGAALRHSVARLLAAAVLQGVALACLLPLFVAVLERRDMGAAAAWLAAFSLAFAVSAWLRWRAYLFEFSGEMIQITLAMRTELGRKLRRLPLQDLGDARSGEIVHTLLTSVDTTLSYVLGVVNAIFTALLVPVVVAVALMFFDWRLGLAVLLVFPIIVWFYHRRRPTFGASARAADQAHKALYADLVEYVQGLPVLRAAGRTQDRALSLQAGFDALEALQSRDTRLGASPTLFMTSAVEFGLLAVVVLGAVLVALGQLGWAVFAAFLVISLRFAEPMSSLVLYTYMFDLLESAMDDIEALLSRPDQVVVAPEARAAVYDVVFDDVTFQYAGTLRPGLDGVTLRCPQRGMTAIVGPSGSGKSTLARIVQRYADPQAGQVRIGGVDIRHMAPEHLGALVSVVFQDVYLFHASVLDNIRMARPGASLDEVRAAARAANCDAFVAALPQGYETMMGDNGASLSGGERQRISIARAMLKDSPIVILDEPTSSLDIHNEVLVQEAISRLVADRTVIVISHRLSTIQGADNIIVFDHGKVCEQGTHEGLMQAGGRYRAMYEAQARMPG